MRKQFVLVTTILVLALIGGVLARAQNGSPVPVTLKPEASKRFIEIAQAHNRVFNECNAVLKARADEQMALLIGADVPVEMRQNCGADESGIVTCRKPEVKK